MRELSALAEAMMTLPTLSSPTSLSMAARHSLRTRSRRSSAAGLGKPVRVRGARPVVATLMEVLRKTLAPPRYTCKLVASRSIFGTAPGAVQPWLPALADRPDAAAISRTGFTCNIVASVSGAD
jgi:hypothetical protein